MVGMRRSPLQVLRPRPRLRRWIDAIAPLLAFALLAAPASSALRNECDLCPSTCPMHHPRGDAAPGPAAHLHCHGKVAAHHSHSSGTNFSRPPCGNHGLVTATALPPVILTPAQLHRVIMRAERAAPRIAGTADRLSDPPDTRPPILTA